MDHIEKIQIEAKETWFNNHVARIEGTEGLQVIYFEEPGTFNMAMKIIICGRDIAVTGDAGEVLYSFTKYAEWGKNLTLQNILEIPLRHALKNMPAQSGPRWDFDSEKAAEEIREYFECVEDMDYEMLAEGEKEKYDLMEELLRECTNWGNMDGWSATVYNICSNHFEDSEIVWNIAQFGRVLPSRLIGWWTGIQIAVEQILSKGE